MKTARPTREQTRLRILTTADELFRRYGFGKTTVADIAQELGMSTANIYKFFPSRNAILEASAERNVAMMQAELTAIAESGGRAMPRIKRCVLAIFHFHEELLQNERQIFKLVVSAIEENWPCIRQFDDFLLATLTRLVREGIKTKEFRTADPDKSARALLDSLTVALYPHLRYGGIMPVSEARVQSLLNFLARALQ